MPLPPTTNADASNKSSYDLKRTWGRIGWFFAIAIVALAIAGFVTGKPFTFGGGGGEITFGGDDAATTQSTPPNSADGTVVSVTATPAPPTPTPAPPTPAPPTPAPPTPVAAVTAFDLVGRWFGSTGHIYEFSANSASELVFGEFDGFGQGTAQGGGIFAESTFVFDVYDPFGVYVGPGEMHLSDDASSWRGSVFNQFTGFTSPLELSR